MFKLESIKEILLRNWSFMRILRLILGISLGYQAYQMNDAFAWIFSGFFLFQAFSNTGCAGGNCEIPSSRRSTRPLNQSNQPLDKNVDE
jgi:hypothetical protein